MLSEFENQFIRMLDDADDDMLDDADADDDHDKDNDVPKKRAYIM